MTEETVTTEKTESWDAMIVDPQATPYDIREAITEKLSFAREMLLLAEDESAELDNIDRWHLFSPAVKAVEQAQALLALQFKSAWLPITEGEAQVVHTLRNLCDTTPPELFAKAVATVQEVLTPRAEQKALPTLVDCELSHNTEQV